MRRCHIRYFFLVNLYICIYYLCIELIPGFSAIFFVVFNCGSCVIVDFANSAFCVKFGIFPLKKIKKNKAMLDSQADFRARAREIGFNEAELTKLDTLGYNTYGRLAFAANYVPGTTDDAPLLKLGADITDTDPPPAKRMTLVRRLVFESYALASADVRSKVDRRDEDAPRRLAQAERASRHEEQKGRLTGLDLSGELEPSNALIDAVYQLHEDNALKYVRWEVCTKRDQEMMEPYTSGGYFLSQNENKKSQLSDFWVCLPPPRA